MNGSADRRRARLWSTPWWRRSRTTSPEPMLAEDAPASQAPVDPRVPVYAIWHPETGPLLALGMLTAAARSHHDGALTETYEIRRPETADSFLEDLATRSGPAVLLCSDYV